jgi:hypothetical protein
MIRAVSPSKGFGLSQLLVDCFLVIVMIVLARCLVHATLA